MSVLAGVAFILCCCGFQPRRTAQAQTIAPPSLEQPQEPNAETTSNGVITVATADAQGRPIPDVRVVVQLFDRRQRTMLKEGQTDAGGVFRHVVGTDMRKEPWLSLYPDGRDHQPLPTDQQLLVVSCRKPGWATRSSPVRRLNCCTTMWRSWRS